MSISKRLIYMFLGGLLALSLMVGGYVAFAQSGEGGEAGESTVPETEPEPGAAENSGSESSSAESGRFFERGFHGGYDSELLAEALGITVDELEAAYEEASGAAVQQALDEGLITEEQAEALEARGFGFHRGFGHGLQVGSIDFDALLAEALGVTVDELEEARTAVHEARLAEMVEAGVITQEQADLMLAQRAVQEYIDTEAISDALQAAYESAVNDALEAGAITQEQADLMLENMPTFEGRGFGFGGGRGFHGHGGRGFHGPGGFSPPDVDSQSSAETSGA